MVANGTWKIVSLPLEKSSSRISLYINIKYNFDVGVDRFKNRLITKGYTQQHSIDYHDTFSFVAKIVTVRCLIVVAVRLHWSHFQMDVTNIFLQGDLDEDIYIEVPQEFSSQGESMVLSAVKILYGLKQASIQWNIIFAQVMIDVGFESQKMINLYSSNMLRITLLFCCSMWTK